jgi:RHS repeat-associated protein
LPDAYTVNVFDSLVLKNAEFPDANGDYEHDATTEQVYLSAGGQPLGRAFYATGLPAVSTSDIHVFLNMGDALGSTSFVVDQGTGEVVESSTYLAYGAVDSDYRPARWQQPREDLRYTGQWDDAEVGLVYMHARYYLPELGRFVSGDPLALQGARGDLNPYAYASGSPFRYTDPTGFLGEADTSNTSADDPPCNSVVCGATGTLQVPEITIQGQPAQKPLSFAPPSVNFDSLRAGHSDNPWE